MRILTCMNISESQYFTTGFTGQRMRFAKLPRYLLKPIPLILLQPVLHRIVTKIAKERPNLFQRIGPHKDKKFLIDPSNFPFSLVLEPHPERPKLRAYNRDQAPITQARISGSFLTLLNMIDGELDGDALFFTRELVVEGDTEAVVCLRNALDDVEGSIAEDVANIFGRTGLVSLNILRRIKKN